jgi:glutaredoxin
MEQKIEFVLPLTNGFTIYSKSGCPNCTNVKKLLQDNKIEYYVIDCDDYLIENRDNFLEFMKNITETEIKTFPVIFLDGKFLGGFKEVKDYIEKISLSFDLSTF